MPPYRARQPDGIYTNDYWPAATGKLVLGNIKLMDELGEIGANPERLKRSTMDHVQRVMQNKSFDLGAINRACKAAR